MESPLQLNTGVRRPYNSVSVMYRSALIASLGLLASCGVPADQSTLQKTPQPSPVASALASDSVPADTVRSAPRAVAWYLDREEGCDLDSTVAHPDALALVREFVARDGAGEFAMGSNWLGGAVLCPGHLPGPDSFTAIDTVEVLAERAVLKADSAWVPVRYVRLGIASANFFERATEGELGVDTFLVVRTAAGWRVDSPAMPMQIRASVAAEWQWLGDSTRALVRTALESSRKARAAGA